MMGECKEYVAAWLCHYAGLILVSSILTGTYVVARMCTGCEGYCGYQFGIVIKRNTATGG
jgi:hypothetical protein